MAKLKDKLVRKLEKIPGVSHQPWPERGDGFSTVHFEGKEIAHFHHFNETDIRLGKQLISENKLVHPTNSIFHPKRSKNSAYIEIPFNSDADVDQIAQLIELVAK